MDIVCLYFTFFFIFGIVAAIVGTILEKRGSRFSGLETACIWLFYGFIALGAISLILLYLFSNWGTITLGNFLLAFGGAIILPFMLCFAGIFSVYTIAMIAVLIYYIVKWVAKWLDVKL